MDISEFKNRKDQMETEIRDAICRSMESFTSDTGYSPNSIHVHLESNTRIGDEAEQFIVSEVKASVEI